MIKYNWDKIKHCVKGRPEAVVALIFLMTEGTVPKQRLKYLKGLDLKGLSGDSFILYPNKLLENLHSYNEAEIIMYIHLASLRNYAAYHLEGKASLPLLHADIHEKYIKQNRLLDIVGYNIHFKYEEIKNGN
jgi:hypothetical protein